LIGANPSFSEFCERNWPIIIDLPTPVLPVKNTGLLIWTNISRIVEYLTVSIVGTSSEKNGSLGSYSN
jgi:hypothetical protein